MFPKNQEQSRNKKTLRVSIYHSATDSDIWSENVSIPALDAEILSQRYIHLSINSSAASPRVFILSERKDVMQACSTTYSRNWDLPSTADQWSDQPPDAEEVEFD